MKQRVILALAAVAAWGCGGGGENKPAESTAAKAPAATPAPPAAAPSATAGQPITGKTWDVKMEGDATGSKFTPANLTIKQGDGVRFTVVTAPPHNVQFWPDSIPAGAASVLQSNMPETTGPLAGPLKMNPGDTYTISFAGAPKGTYKVYCLPHLALGMKGSITVQ